MVDSAAILLYTERKKNRRQCCLFIAYCQYGEVWQYKRRRIYLGHFFYLQYEMLCTKHIICFLTIFAPHLTLKMIDSAAILLLSSPEGTVLLKCCLVRLARAFYITRQDQWKTIPEGENK
jgi:hypothetical protein